MTRNAGGWSYREDRRLLELAAQSRSAEEIAHLMNRSPDAVRRLAIRLGVSLRKNSRQSTPTERLIAGRTSGTAVAPGIAARSPTYAFRQLYDFKSGGRKGANSELMKPVVENLSIDDMIALVAYTASLM